MNYAAYRQAYFVEPTPMARFDYVGIQGVTLFFTEYERAVEFYTAVLGPPAYVEGDDTRGWQLGSSWLTLLRGGDGAAKNVEVPIIMATPAEAERLHAAFLAAGATGETPTDQLMYAPIRYCPLADPFGTAILIYSPLAQSTADY